MKWKIENGYLVHMCPGCGHKHYIALKGLTDSSVQWTWNEKTETLLSSEGQVLYSSVRLTWIDHYDEQGEPIQKQCHYHIENGKIRYVDDGFSHDLTGQTVELPEL